jgi:uroporphyrinogen decarboxylase
MNHRERFRAVMRGEPFDRVPAYYFGTWPETLEAWRDEGIARAEEIPAAAGLDPDWEAGMWRGHGLVNLQPIPDGGDEVVAQTNDFIIHRTALGALIKSSRRGSSIPQHLEHALKPTAESWKQFRAWLDPEHPQRRPAGWQTQAEALKRRDGVLALLGGSLFGFARDWMGIEAWSMLPFDDPALYQQIIADMTDFFIAANGPLLRHADFDFAYLFEDCCFNNGPLLSPKIFERFYRPHYRRLVDFYHAQGIEFVLLDSDGKVEALIPHWLEAGIDILFPIEVGTWRADPVALRRRFGPRLRMMGGVDKHVIPRGEAAIRAELEPLRELVRSGGFIPLPDHRIPPDCSFAAFRHYVRIFREIFA